MARTAGEGPSLGDAPEARIATHSPLHDRCPRPTKARERPARGQRRAARHERRAPPLYLRASVRLLPIPCALQRCRPTSCVYHREWGQWDGRESPMPVRSELQGAGPRASCQQRVIGGLAFASRSPAQASERTPTPSRGPRGSKRKGATPKGGRARAEQLASQDAIISALRATRGSPSSWQARLPWTRGGPRGPRGRRWCSGAPRSDH